jgi:molybdopterin converting factor subunit 1
MIIHVRLFARARELAGSDVVAIELSEAASVAELRRCLAAECPALESLLGRSAVAVDGDFAENERVLAADAEVAILPPVSGGSTPLQRTVSDE